MDILEHNLWINYLTESAALFGKECDIHIVKSREDDINHDPYLEYYDPVKINILFEENPKPILKKMGWYSNEEDLPYVVYMTCLDSQYKIIYPEKYSLIDIPNIMATSKQTNKFTITEVKGSKINPLFWICKLVPYKYNLDNTVVNENPKLDSKVANTKYNYLVRKTSE